MIDPKELANQLQVRPFIAERYDASMAISLPERDLIIAALRTYEPPHEHSFSRGSMNPDGWSWMTYHHKWIRSCECGYNQYALHLGPVEETHST